MDTLVWVLVGLLVGTTFSITGVGGALISVPLFVYLDNAPIHLASVWALFAAFTGAVFTVALNRKDTLFDLALKIAGIAILTSFFVARFKPMAPALFIKGLFIAVCAYSFWQVVAKKGFALRPPSAPTNHSLQRLVLIGISQGFLMTMTGLGGGVILMPMLLGPLKVPAKQAVPTSCLTIAIASLGSIAAQFSQVSETLDPIKILLLIVAVLLTTLSTRFILSLMKVESVARLRTGVYATLLAVSMVALALK